MCAFLNKLLYTLKVYENTNKLFCRDYYIFILLLLTYPYKNYTYNIYKNGINASQPLTQNQINIFMYYTNTLARRCDSYMNT